jgi:NAD(P)-dependent dehydrogenase (short-subunit alcohol dehydrogenase family)
MNDYRNRKVFITGGSSGIGLAAAGEFVRRGAHVAIFARNRERLDGALLDISALKAAESQHLSAISLDVADWPAVREGMEKAVADFGVPDLLFNCAGRAYPRRFEDIGMDQFQETLNINLMGTIHTTVTLVPHMKKRGGAIVSTSSVAGLIGVFGYTDYCPSKYGVIGFSEALRSELKPFGIKVQVLCPPDTDTPGFKTENLTKPEETKRISAGAKILTPEQVVKALLKGLGGNSFLIIPGFEARMTCLLKRLFPWLVEWVMDAQIRKVGKERGVR